MRYEKIKIKITDRCNRNCKYCVFNNHSIDLSFNSFKQMLHSIQNIEFEKFHINGGEPLLNSSFIEMVNYAKQFFPDKIFVLGTNGVGLNTNYELLRYIKENFDEICIGCDDEHRNIDIVEEIVPFLCSNSNITIILNSLIEYTSESTKKRCEKLSELWNVICVQNHVYHTKSGKPINNLRKGLCSNQNKVLMIQENGDYYRCFNCAIPDDAEGNIFSPDFISQISNPRTTHFSYCPWCKCYE